MPELDSFESFEDGFVVQNARANKQESNGAVVGDVAYDFEEDVRVESRQWSCIRSLDHHMKDSGSVNPLQCRRATHLMKLIHHSISTRRLSPLISAVCFVTGGVDDYLQHDSDLTSSPLAGSTRVKTLPRM